MNRIVCKLKTNKKFRTQFIGIAVACVVVIVLAIAIPVKIHNSKIDVQPIEAESASNAEYDITLTTAPQVELTTEEITEAPTETPTEAPTQASATTKSVTKASTTKSVTKPATTAQTVEQTTQWLWTEADLQDVVNQAKAYATSKGIVIDSSLSEVGTTWLNPVTTDWCRSKARAIQGVKYQIDEAYNDACKNGYDPSWGPFSINIFYKPWNSIATYPEDTCWGIYVVV